MSNIPENDGLADTAAAGSEDLPIGSFIGEYKIEDKLGQGGMGSVYAARHPVIGKRVAVKVLSYFFSRDAGLVRRFTDEARAANKIGHPNIIDIFSFGQLPDQRHYFVMEYLEGETMTAWLERGRPAFAEARRFLLQVCEALEAAHREGIIHRDLKPDNIWIARPKHGEPYIKVLDFGIAKLTETDQERSATRTGTVLGTPQFMSPEQCVGRGVDHRTDIYALGAILYRTYCGRMMFDGDSAAEILSAQLYQKPEKPSLYASIPPALETLILDCLEKDPNRRPASAAELGMRLKDAAQLVGAATEIHAPLHATGKAAAATHKGFAANGTKSEPKPKGKNKRVLIVLALLVVAATLAALWPLPRKPSTASAPVQAPAANTAPAPIATPPAAPAPTASPTAEAEPTPAPPTQASPTRAKRAAKPTPAPTSPATDGTDSRKKPSRAAREGLIQENPF